MLHGHIQSKPVHLMHHHLLSFIRFTLIKAVLPPPPSQTAQTDGTFQLGAQPPPPPPHHSIRPTPFDRLLVCRSGTGPSLPPPPIPSGTRMP